MSNIQNNEKMRLARMEAVCNQLRSEMDDVMRCAYEKAVEDRDEERAAELARKIRNRMLDMSDAQMSLDRIGLDTSSAAAFLASLGKIFKNSWAVYRQHLRDISEQEGFPFNIDWGIPPDAERGVDK
jgi:hypothetical protein